MVCIKQILLIIFFLGIYHLDTGFKAQPGWTAEEFSSFLAQMALVDKEPNPILLAWVDFSEMVQLVKALNDSNWKFQRQLIFIQAPPDLSKPSSSHVQCHKNLILASKKSSVQLQEHPEIIKSYYSVQCFPPAWKPTKVLNEVVNPSEKPLITLIYLLKPLINSQMTLVDACCGSGSCTRAAGALGISSVAFDKDPNMIRASTTLFQTFLTEVEGGEWVRFFFFFFSFSISHTTGKCFWL